MKFSVACYILRITVILSISQVSHSRPQDEDDQLELDVSGEVLDDGSDEVPDGSDEVPDGSDEVPDGSDEEQVESDTGPDEGEGDSSTNESLLSWMMSMVMTAVDDLMKPFFYLMESVPTM